MIYYKNKMSSADFQKVLVRDERLKFLNNGWIFFEEVEIIQRFIIIQLLQVPDIEGNTTICYAPLF